MPKQKKTKSPKPLLSQIEELVLHQFERTNSQIVALRNHQTFYWAALTHVKEAKRLAGLYKATSPKGKPALRAMIWAHETSAAWMMTGPEREPVPFTLEDMVTAARAAGAQVEIQLPKKHGSTK